MLKTLSSLKLTIILLLCVSFLCLIGTVFPQNGDVVSAGHGWASRILSLLSPYDIFHSIWFMATGLLLCINLILCMKQRARLKKRNLLMLLLHGSIVLVIAGYAVGYISLDGRLEIPEGETVSRALLKDGSTEDLGFSVRCDRFAVDFYDNGMPKEFISDLSFIKDGRVADRAQVMVNHPARFSGINFYQETYRQALSAAMTISDGKETKTISAVEGDVIPLSPAGTQAHVVKIWDDLMHAGPAMKLYIENPSGERYLWVFQHIDTIKSRTPDLFERVPDLDPSGFQPYTFSLEHLHASFVTGIGVKRDPGVPLVAVGGTLFLISLLLVYLAPRSRPGPKSRPSGKGAGPAEEGPVHGVPERDKGKGSKA